LNIESSSLDSILDKAQMERYYEKTSIEDIRCQYCDNKLKQVRNEAMCDNPECPLYLEFQ
jgi:hypothetical protein